MGTKRRWGIGLALTALGLAALGCAGPLDSERAAFDRWTEHGEYMDAAPEPSPTRATPPAEREPNAPDALPEAPSLEDYLAYALEHNPGIHTAFHQWKAALERVPQARTLMDPQLSYSRVVTDSDMGTRQTVGLAQTFPWYATLRARGDVALEEALAAEQQFEQQRQDVLREVKDAFIEYAYLARSLAVMRENREILEDLQAAARARFEAGEAPYADVVRAGVAIEQLDDEIASVRARREPLVGRLNAALGRPATRPLPWPERIPEASFDTEEDALVNALSETNPELQALDHQIAGGRHAISVARRNWIPDLMLGVEYMDMRQDDDAVELMASINVPLYRGRLDAERAEAIAAFGAATKQRTDRRHALQAELRLAWHQFLDADRRAGLFERTLIPMTREALEATEAAYAAGESEFQAVTEAQSALQEVQLTYQRVIADRFQRLAELERLIGRPLLGETPETQEH